MKKFLLALSLMLAVTVFATGCKQNVQPGEDQVVLTLENDLILNYFNVKLYDAETDEQIGDTVSKLKGKKSQQYAVDKNSVVYFKAEATALKLEERSIDIDVKEEDLAVYVSAIFGI